MDTAGMIPELLVLVVFPILLAVAAGWDLASYTVPNWVPLALLATFAIFAVVSAMPWAMLGYHALAGGIALAAGFALFAFGIIGGGDAKLFACIAVMFGFRDMLDYALLASLFGGALTLGLLAMRQFPLPQPLAAQAWIARLHNAGSGVPYGVALAAGGLLLLPHTEIFRLAAGL